MYRKEINLIFIGVLFIILFSSCISNNNSTEENFPEPEQASNKLKGVLAVNYFTNNIDDDNTNWISRSINDFIISKLVLVDSLQVVSRENLNAVYKEQKLTLSGMTKEEIKLGQILKADYILTGSYSVRQNVVDISYQIINTETSEILTASQEDGTIDDLYGLQQKLFYRLLYNLGISLKPDLLIAEDYTSDLASLKKYYTAEELAEKNQIDKAEELLRSVLKENPYYTPAEKQLSAIGIKTVKTNGSAILSALDDKEKARIRIKNLNDSFINYAEANGFEIKIGDLVIERSLMTDGDKELYQINSRGFVTLRLDFLPVLKEFVLNHPYISEAYKHRLTDKIEIWKKSLKRNQWMELIDQWKESGIDPAEFAKEKGVSLRDLKKWIKTMGDATFYQYRSLRADNYVIIPFTERGMISFQRFGGIRISLMDVDGNAFKVFESFNRNYNRQNFANVEFSSWWYGYDTEDFFSIWGGDLYNITAFANTISFSEGEYKIYIDKLERSDIKKIANIKIEPFFKER